MKLAQKDGCTVHEAKQRYSYREYLLWVAYDRIYPFGSEVENMRAALIAYTTACGLDYKGSRPKFDDFVLGSETSSAPKQQTDRQMWSTLMAGTMAMKAMGHKVEIK